MHTTDTRVHATAGNSQRNVSVTRADAPFSYASADVLARYFARMGELAAAVTSRGRSPIVYVCGGGGAGLYTSTGMARRARLIHDLAPAYCLTYRAVWPVVARPGSLGELPEFPAGLASMLSRVDGVAIMLDASGLIGAATAAVIAAARSARMPIVVRSAGGVLTPLVDCQMRAVKTGARIDLPRGMPDRGTLRAAFAAMGVGVTA